MASTAKTRFCLAAGRSMKPGRCIRSLVCSTACASRKPQGETITCVFRGGFRTVCGVGI